MFRDSRMSWREGERAQHADVRLLDDASAPQRGPLGRTYVSRKVPMSRRQVLSVIVLLTVLGWSVVLVAVGETAAAAAAVPALVLSAEQVVTSMTGTTRVPVANDERVRVAGDGERLRVAGDGERPRVPGDEECVG